MAYAIYGMSKTDVEDMGHDEVLFLIDNVERITTIKNAGLGL